MSSIYRPKVPIVVASSTEGVVWDGAKECYLVTHNAAIKNIDSYRSVEPFDRVIEPAEFVKDRAALIGTEYFDAALKLRPLVKKAWHYFLVLGMIRDNPEWTKNILANPHEESAYKDFVARFGELKAFTNEETQKRLDKIFYDERKRMMTSDQFSWLDLYEPIGSRWEELGKLAETKKIEDDCMGQKKMSGFMPAFATSKDETSTRVLCSHFVRTKRLDGRHYADDGSQYCTIPSGFIVGVERVPSRKKTDQLEMLRSIAEVPKTQVWNFNDMYDRKEMEELWRNNYRFNFMLPGYVFPFDVEKAKNDPLVTVLDENFAERLGDIARGMDL